MRRFMEPAAQYRGMLRPRYGSTGRGSSRRHHHFAARPDRNRASGPLQSGRRMGVSLDPCRRVPADNVHRIYTFNTRDFEVFPELTVVVPPEGLMSSAASNLVNKVWNY